ncbi:MAG: ABC transporter ATP-binding protein [Treponema sp.]
MRNIKILISYVRGQLHIYGLAFIFTILSQIIVATEPQLIKITIDSVIGIAPLPKSWIGYCVALFAPYLPEVSGLLVMAGFIIVFSLLRALFTFARITMAGIATERSIKALRNRLYNHIQLLPYAYHAKTKTGDLIQRCTSDIDTIRMALSSQILDATSAVFFISYAVYVMGQLQIRLMVISLIGMLITFGISAVFFSWLRREFKKATEYESAMTTVIQENLTGIRVVKAFTRHPYEIDRFTKRSEVYRNQNLKIATGYAWFWAISDGVWLWQVFGTIIYGSILAYRGSISAGDLAAFISYTVMITGPVHSLGRTISAMGKALVSVNRLETILHEQPEVLFPTDKKPSITGDIVFHAVSFAYPESKDRPVLENISFSIKSGQTLAIIGPTGSGKSSLVHLLSRLYEYDSGSITVNGVELNTIDKGWIRSQIGLVLQEPFLFSKTIMENLKLAAPDVDESVAQYYATIASLDSEISHFDQGYATMVGERGVSLSGGQKQRLAIARTLVKDPAVLIFDDSLSAVDTQTDSNIRRALKAEKGGKTVIIISHRIATVCDADKIIVLEHGTITQEGTHAELIVQEGLYKRIYGIQAAMHDPIQ